MSKTLVGPDGKPRCHWCGATPEYIDYHDTEWGFPIKDDQRLFEKICLEGFQSGLSWRTILEKRENFRKAFKNFDFNKVARFTEKGVYLFHVQGMTGKEDVGHGVSAFLFMDSLNS